MSTTEHYDVVIVGAGFSGLYLLHRLRQAGLSVRVIEAGNDVGGTWYWNRYPGARCDVETLDYSFSFSTELEQEWHWPDRYAVQPDILRYAQHVADRFDLRRNITFDTRVTTAVWDDDAANWAIETTSGGHLTATWLIMATGCLSVPRMPDVSGLENFTGPTYHTGNWPHYEVDFSGLHVGLIGTGSSAIQSIPIIARKAEHLTVFQRTPNFSMPAFNGPLDPDIEREHKAHYPQHRETARWSFGGYLIEDNADLMPMDAPEVVKQEMERRWRQGGFNLLGVYADIMTDSAVNKVVTEFVHNKIREKVNDPATADLLCPKDHPFGTKRLCVDTDYYETYNRDNVSLVDIRTTPIKEITATGLQTSKADYSFDAMVYATGFDAMTGALLNVDIRGRNGLKLGDKWVEGPRSYLGIAIAGFPNLFTMTGPGSPSVLTNMLTAIEQHVEWVSNCILDMRDRQLRRIEPSAEAESNWVAHVNETADATLYPEANSWYMGANIPGKPRVFSPYAGGVGAYRKICDEVVANDYNGFEVTR